MVYCVTQHFLVSITSSKKIKIEGSSIFYAMDNDILIKLKC